MRSVIPTIEQIRLRLEFNQKCLQQRITLTIINPIKIFPVDYQNRVKLMKQNINNPLEFSKYVDIMVLQVDGCTQDLNIIAKNLMDKFDGEQAMWKQNIRNYLQLKNYRSCSTRQIWEVKSKYLDILRPYYIIDQLSNIRKRRHVNHKIVLKLKSLIDKLVNIDEQQKLIRKNYVDLLNEQECYLELEQWYQQKFGKDRMQIQNKQNIKQQKNEKQNKKKKQVKEQDQQNKQDKKVKKHKENNKNNKIKNQIKSNHRLYQFFPPKNLNNAVEILQQNAQQSQHEVHQYLQSQNLQPQNSQTKDNIIKFIDSRQVSIAALRQLINNQKIIQQCQNRRNRYLYIKIHNSDFCFEGYELTQKQQSQFESYNSLFTHSDEVCQQIDYEQLSEEQYENYKYQIDHPNSQRPQKSQCQSQSFIQQDDQYYLNNDKARIPWFFDSLRQEDQDQQLKIHVIDQQKFPLQMKKCIGLQNKQTLLEFIKLIHAKDNLNQIIENLKNKFPEFSKKDIRKFINQISIRKGPKRFIKQQIIQHNIHSLLESNIDIQDLINTRTVQDNSIITQEYTIEFIKIINGSHEKTAYLINQLKTRFPELSYSQIKRQFKRISYKSNGRNLIKQEIIEKYTRLLNNVDLHDMAQQRLRLHNEKRRQNRRNRCIKQKQMMI